MNLDIKESRILKIEHKIVSLHNVRNLARIIDDEYINLKGEDKDARVKYSAWCFDGSRFSSENIGLFDEESVLNRKRVQGISVSFSSYDTGLEIDVDLSHGDRASPYSNRIKVSGDNTNWVNGTLKRLEEVVESFSPQNTFLVRNRYIVTAVLAIGIGVIYLWVMSFVPSDPSESPSESERKIQEFLEQALFIYYLIKYLIACAFGWFPALMLVDKLQTLWPVLEIQIGPEHTLIEKQRRTWILGAILVGIVPLLTSFVYDLIKVIV